MIKKRIYLILTSVLVAIIAIGTGSILWTYTQENNIKKEFTTSANIDKQKFNPIVSKDTKILLRTIYEKGGEIVDKDISSKEYKGKTKEELSKIFYKEGYELKQMVNNKIVLIKRENRYAPNKYVVGIKDGYIAIFKTDDKGREYIENENKDITNIKTKLLPKEDVNLLTNGNKDFQFDTREEAEGSLEDYE